MDCGKVGGVIRALRKEKGLTQKALANAVNISDKAVSKWERGLGCPDVSLLAPLADTLNVNIEKILSGDARPGKKKGGHEKYKILLLSCLRQCLGGGRRSTGLLLRQKMRAAQSGGGR